MNQLNADWYRENAKPRQIDGHKKSFGHVMVIGGSIGKSGAPILTSKAALRSGCGLVTSYVPENAVQALLCVAPEIMSISQQAKDFQGIDLRDLDAIAFGPGLGKDVVAGQMLSRLLSNLYEKALVIDADGLNLLALEPHKLLLLNSRHVLTPHVGEFARLMGDQFDASKIHQQAHEFAQKYGVNLVLKGKNSRIYGYNGLVFENTTGNSGMATAGSGDVLTGIIASLCAQGYETQLAACMGVYLHGLAGDKAIESQSEASLIASDLVEALKLVMNYEL
jgi:NAD(P)H-hydrate epimerase